MSETEGQKEDTPSNARAAPRLERGPRREVSKMDVKLTPYFTIEDVEKLSDSAKSAVRTGIENGDINKQKTVGGLKSPNSAAEGCAYSREKPADDRTHRANYAEKKLPQDRKTAEKRPQKTAFGTPREYQTRTEHSESDVPAGSPRTCGRTRTTLGHSRKCQERAAARAVGVEQRQVVRGGGGDHIRADARHLAPRVGGADGAQPLGAHSCCTLGHWTRTDITRRKELY
ncbi:hypothetical protein C8R44DRAFT_742682 [Mycena epipterygia]|nr:hypothetical protein C8R44DRAFT_742682 [Mycena epipterygia]